MKFDNQWKEHGIDVFPILGGRLLKAQQLMPPANMLKFPILGGRLLKIDSLREEAIPSEVSNPWREAIEANN